MQLHTWLLFLLTSIGISLSPGPNCLLVLTHSALYGPRRALVTIAGGLLGFIAIIAMCTFGIGTLLESSVHWLTALKWLGGAYLFWLGIKLWRSPPIDVSFTDAVNAQGKPMALFNQGLLSGITNPKSILFFTALLPQFIDPHRSLALQFVVIAATYTVTEFLVEYAIALGALSIRPWLVRVGRRFNKACGGLFMAIGAALPLRA